MSDLNCSSMRLVGIRAVWPQSGENLIPVNEKERAQVLERLLEVLSDPQAFPEAETEPQWRA